MPFIPLLKNIRKKSKEDWLEKRKNESAKYYNDSAWRNLSQSFRKIHPYCEICALEGISTPVRHVHHIIPFLSSCNEAERYNLLLNPNNLVSLCELHHREVHKGLHPRYINKLL